MAPLGEISDASDASEVASLTVMVLTVPVDQSRQPTDGRRYLIAFNLLDGTRVTRAEWLGRGELSRGILLPQTFAGAVASALRA